MTDCYGVVMAQLRFRLLGPFEVFYAGKRLKGFENRTAESLLAYLVTYRDQAHSRKKLVDEFWSAEEPEEPEKKRRKLTLALDSIRDAFKSVDLEINDYILRLGSDSVRFNPDNDIYLDTQEFEQLLEEGRRNKDVLLVKRAVELFRGSLMEGFDESWISLEQIRLDDLYLRALDQLIRFSEECREYDEVIRYAWRSLSCNPLHDGLNYRLIALLHHTGSQHAALSLCKHYSGVMRKNGLEPLKEITELCEEIRVGPTKTRIPLTEALPSLFPARFAGRKQELQSLLAHWQKAKAGMGRLVLVEGEGGVGKTRLVKEFLGEVGRASGQVLSGACYDAKGGTAYQPFTEALRAYLDQPDAVEQLRKKVSPCLGALVKLFPQYAEEFKTTASEPLPRDLERNHFFQCLFQILLSISAEWPLALFLDDLHWADEGSLEYLKFLVSRLRDCRMLIVGAYRAEELNADHPLNAIALQALKKEVGETLTVQPLGAPDTRRLLEGMVGSAEVTAQLDAWLSKETGGNPFLLVELVRALSAEGTLVYRDGRWELTPTELGPSPIERIPETIEGAILSRWRRLQRGAQETSRLLAVVGRPVELETLIQADGQDEQAILESLEELSQRRLINLEANGYTFAHSIIGKVIYGKLEEGRRRYLHRRVGQALEVSHPSRLNRIAGELAHHFTQAQEWEKALDYRIRAAESAARSYTNSTTVEHFKEALELIDRLEARTDDPTELLAKRVDVLRGLGNAYWSLGELDQARACWQQDIQLAEGIGDKGRLGKAYGNMGLLFGTLGQYQEACKYHQQSLDLFQQTGDKQGMGLTLNNLGAVYWRLHEYDQAREHWNEALSVAQEIEDRRVKSFALGNLGLVHYNLGA